MKSVILVLALSLCSRAAEAKLSVVTSITDLAAITREVGGDAVGVESIAKGTQDPHFIEAKPSYMLKISRADLLVVAGLELEVGWIPSLVQGARNPKVKAGGQGYLEIGPRIEPLEVPAGKLTRAEGDVHPDGNPHFYLDPIRMGKAAAIIAARLGELDPAHAAGFAARARALDERLQAKTRDWKKRIDATGVRKVVTFHRTLTYFLDRFGLGNPITLEPKPGIPPTSGHIIDVIQTMKAQKIPLILVENYFDASVTKKITQEIPGSRSATVPVSVEGEPGIGSTEDLVERIVKAIEGK